MLVHPDTLSITAVLDEFTNATPAQFAYDPPWWLLLVGSETWLQRGHTVAEFVAAYKRRMEQFVRAVERAEARSEARETLRGQRSPFWLDARVMENWTILRRSYIDVTCVRYPAYSLGFQLTIKGYITIPSSWARSQISSSSGSIATRASMLRILRSLSPQFAVLALLSLPLGLLPRFLRYPSRRFHHLLIRREGCRSRRHRCHRHRRRLRAIDLVGSRTIICGRGKRSA